MPGDKRRFTDTPVLINRERLEAASMKAGYKNQSDVDDFVAGWVAGCTGLPAKVNESKAYHAGFALGDQERGR